MRKITFLLVFTFFTVLEKALAQPPASWEGLYNYINDSLINKQRYDEAHTLSTQNFQIAEKEFGNIHLNYFRNAYQLGQILYFKKNYTQGIHFLNETIDQIKKTPLKDSLFYGRTLNLLGISYRRINDLDNAGKAYLEAYFTLLKLEKTYPKEYSACLNNLAVLYREIGKTDEAIEFGTKALAYAPKNSENYAARLNTLALLYKRKGQFKQALQMTQEALAQTDTANVQYPLRLISLAYLYGEIGLLDKALALDEQASAIIERKTGRNSIEYAAYANGMSFLNVRLGNFKPALDYALHACQIAEKSKEQADYYYYLAQQAYCLMQLSDLDKALPLALEAKTQLAIKPGKKSEQYIMVLATLVGIHQKKGNVSEALKINEEQIDLIKTAWSDKEESYITSQLRLIELYNNNNKPDKSTELLKALADNMNGQVLYNLDVLDEYSKEIFINNFIKNYEPLLFSQIKNAPEIDINLITKAYEAELAIKGIILGSSQLFHQAIQKLSKVESQPKSDIQNPKYTEGVNFIKEWNNLKDNISKAYTRNTPQKQIDSLTKQLSIIEEHMINLMPELQRIQRKTTRFEDVKNALKSDACAIEFVRFKYHNNHNWTDSILYGALMVLPDKTAPDFIYLCTETDLKTLLNKSKNPQQLYATRGKRNTDDPSVLQPSKELYNLILKPLEPYFKGMKTINYAPSGLLHQVAFAALPVNETDLLSDQFQLNALSSTRELVKSNNDFKIENATFYGGIQYGETTIKDPSNTNTPWPYLEGTKKEIDRISDLFKKKNIKFDLKQGLLASEETLKAKNVIANESVATEGVSPDILHIATHGFFYKNKQDITTNSAFQTANNPLIRSGLIMANANKVWLGETPQEGREDGILTAYEISNLDLSKTHLVVLSACETGLGDIQGTEGVYGLQRAFKMAGVEYILMSLWQVPDKQTAELMAQFYSNLLNGATIQAAFSTAQQSMKEKYSPYYWAGFVLMR
jgi:CHAT domain-containing protein/lipopolysaccharide biosynthesis regulator YciM